MHYIYSSENVTTVRMRRKEWVKEKMDVIETGIFEACAILDEMPPTDPPTDVLSSSEATLTVNQTWLSDAKAATETAIGEEDIPYPTPSDALQLYKGIYGQIVGQLKQVEPKTQHRSGTVDGRDEYVLEKIRPIIHFLDLLSTSWSTIRRIQWSTASRAHPTTFSLAA